MRRMRASRTCAATDLSCATHRSVSTGFTLVELLITILVTAVLVAMAVPGFERIMASSRLTGTANSIVGALNTARMDAVKHNGTTQFCSDDGHANGDGTLGTACGSGIGAVVALVTSNGAAAATTVLGPLTINTGRQQLSGHAAAIQFAPSGLGHAIGTTLPFTGQIADIANDAAGANTHRLVCMTTGSILRVIETDGGVACPR